MQHLLKHDYLPDLFLLPPVPEPYTKYQIWVRALVNGRESPDSAIIEGRTDVDAPSAPTITNLTCYGTGALLVRWLRDETTERVSRINLLLTTCVGLE